MKVDLTEVVFKNEVVDYIDLEQVLDILIDEDDITDPQVTDAILYRLEGAFRLELAGALSRLLYARIRG